MYSNNVGGDTNMEIDKKGLGIRIHNLRVGENMSMDELAEKVAVSGKSTVNEWEKGRSIPNDVTINNIASLFGTTTDFLLHGSLSSFVKNVLITDGINDAEFNHLLWEYINLTTNTSDILAGIAFDYDSFKPVSEKEQSNINESIVNDAIDHAISQNLNDFIASLKTGSSYPSQPEIIKISTQTLKKNIKILQNTFTGKYHRLIREFDNLDSFEYLNDKVTLEEYLNDPSSSRPWGIGKGANKPNSFIIDHFYQAQLNKMMLEFQEKLFELNVAYHESLNKYPDKN